MTVTEQAKFTGYAVIIAGFVLVFVSAVVPFYTSGYRLLGAVLLAGVVPYLVYGLVVVMLRNMLSIIVGLSLLVVHLWLTIIERFTNSVDYSDGTIYYVPVVMAIALVPLLFLALRATWHK